MGRDDEEIGGHDLADVIRERFIDCWGCGPGGATFLTLKTTTESIAVHLGSTALLQEKNIRLAAGDDLEIVGATTGGASFLLARQLVKGDATWTLREASGCALWSGGSR